MKGLIRSLARGKPQNQAVRRQRIRVSALALSFTGAAGVGWATAVLGDLPEGNILILGGAAYLQFTKAASASGITATFDGTYSVGSTPTADATLTGTDIDVIGVATISAATAGVSPVTRGVNATQVMLDNTDNSLELNLNVTIADASISADTQAVTATGYVDIVYSVLGDD